MAEHIARVYVQQGGRTETLADLLDAAYYVNDLTRAAKLLVAECDSSENVDAACAVTELTAVAMNDFVERFRELLIQEGAVFAASN